MPSQAPDTLGRGDQVGRALALALPAVLIGFLATAAAQPTSWQPNPVPAATPTNHNDRGLLTFAWEREGNHQDIHYYYGLKVPERPQRAGIADGDGDWQAVDAWLAIPANAAAIPAAQAAQLSAKRRWWRRNYTGITALGVATPKAADAEVGITHGTLRKIPWASVPAAQQALLNNSPSAGYPAWNGQTFYGHWRPELVDEVSVNTWEVVTGGAPGAAPYLTSIDELKAEAAWWTCRMPPAAIACATAWEGNITGGGSLHRHIVFHRPWFHQLAVAAIDGAATVADVQRHARIRWARKIAGLAGLVNNYANSLSLRANPVNVHCRFLGPYLASKTPDLVALLSRAVAPAAGVPDPAVHMVRGVHPACAGSPNYIECPDDEGHAIGHWKFGMVSLRQNYGSSENIGFEFRATGVHHSVLAQVANLLTNWGAWNDHNAAQADTDNTTLTLQAPAGYTITPPGGALVDLGAIPAPYAMTSLHDARAMPRVNVADHVLDLNAQTGVRMDAAYAGAFRRDYENAVTALVAAVNALPEPNNDLRRYLPWAMGGSANALGSRWTWPLIVWEEHPAVVATLAALPAATRVAKTAAFTAAMVAWRADFVARATAILADGAQTAIQKQTAIEQAIHNWVRGTNVHRFF